MAINAKGLVMATKPPAKLDPLGKRINSQGIYQANSISQAPVIGVIDNTNICRIGDQTTVSRTPILTACRELLAQGVNPDRALEIYRRGILAVRVRSIGEGARLTIREDRHGVELAPHRTAFAHDGIKPRAAIEAPADMGGAAA
jgi:hypothetical protein